MSGAQFRAAVELAKSGESLPVDDGETFWGFALPDFAPVWVTIAQLASLIRWEALQFNGEFDNEALQTIQKYGRKRFQII